MSRQKNYTKYEFYCYKLIMRMRTYSKSCSKDREGSAQEHKGSGGESCCTLLSMIYSLMLRRKSANTSEVVNFLLYSTCLAGSITYWIFSEEQKPELGDMQGAQNVLGHWGRCVFAGSQCSCSVQKHLPPLLPSEHLPTHWKSLALPQIHAKEAKLCFHK